MRLTGILLALAIPTLGLADGISFTVYGAPLYSTALNPVEITFLLNQPLESGIEGRTLVVKTLPDPYGAIVFSLPSQPFGYYVGPPEGALYIWLSPDTTSINLLPALRVPPPPPAPPPPADGGDSNNTDPTPPVPGSGGNDNPPPPTPPTTPPDRGDPGSNPPPPPVEPVSTLPEPVQTALLAACVAATACGKRRLR